MPPQFHRSHGNAQAPTGVMPLKGVGGRGKCVLCRALVAPGSAVFG